MRRFHVLLLVILLLSLCVACDTGVRSRPYYPAKAVPIDAPERWDAQKEDATNESVLKTGVVVINAASPVSYRVEIADTADSRNLGLMHRTSLAEDAGMLFVFDSEVTRYFWMKNTLIPLDILYIAANRTIVDIQTMQPCTSEPCKTYPSKAKAQYALEINAGEAQKKGFAVGQDVVLPD